MDFASTIVAVSSPSGNSSHALVRASGNTISTCIKQLGLVPTPRHLTPCTVKLPEGALPVLCMSFPEPFSYTGQDTVEILLVNNDYLVNSLVEKLIDLTSGRHAEPGEFTARAFFNGKINLSQAEGVCATISAGSDGELRGAALLRGGALHSVSQPISNKILKMLTLVEAGIDFTDEEDVTAITIKELANSIEQTIDSIQSILDSKISMVMLQHLPRVVIAGTPNAGKSTLYNTILGKKRVVVSESGGTTRDAIQEPVFFGTKEAILIDVAGFEKPTDDMSASMQTAALETMKSADLILWCVAPNDPCPDSPSNAIIVRTKSDLEGFPNTNNVCSITGEGIGQLKKAIEQHLFSTPIPSENAIALLPRHVLHLQETLTSLERALVECSTPELTASSLREALNAIGSITGSITPDEVLGEVFSSFCIGK